MKHQSHVAAASDVLLFYELVPIYTSIAKSISGEWERNGDKSKQTGEGMAMKCQSTKSMVFINLGNEIKW